MAKTTTMEVREVATWKINLPYFVLVMIMVGQSVAAVNVMLGQVAYFAANVAAIYHVFALGRPTADKVKNLACFAVTVTIMVVKTFG